MQDRLVKALFPDEPPGTSLKDAVDNYIKRLTPEELKALKKKLDKE